MSLLQQINKDVKKYKAYLNRINERLEKGIIAVKEERRLGIAEAQDYYHQDRQHGGVSDTVEFEPTEGPIAAPIQHPSEERARRRFHVIYDPSTGKISDLRQTKPFERIPSEFVQPNAQQMHDVMKHLEKMDPRLADRLVSGILDIWIPRTQAAPGHASTLAAHTASTGGMTRREMSPDQLAAARQAASKMTLAK